jgi:hypothetical protein
MPKRKHRGTRSALVILCHLPPWAKTVLRFLQTLPVSYRKTAIRHLRWIADYLEREWTSASPPSVAPWRPEELKFEPEDDATMDALLKQQPASSGLARPPCAKHAHGHSPTSMATDSELEDTAELVARPSMALPVPQVRQRPHHVVSVDRPCSSKSRSVRSPPAKRRSSDASGSNRHGPALPWSHSGLGR